MPNITRLPEPPSEKDIRLKYAHQLVRIANRIKCGQPRSEILLACTNGVPAVSALYRAIIEHLFSEIEAADES